MDYSRIYNQVDELTLTHPWYREQVERYVWAAYKSDAYYDLTSKKLIGRSATTNAVIIAKQAGVIAGLTEVVWLLKRVGLTVKLYKPDGATVKKGTKLISLTGNARLLLGVERTALNTLQRLSGIATLTSKYVTAVGKHPAICATRKTNWGALDKKAVSLGGGYTHRLGLFDSVMVKDNHVALVEHNDLAKLSVGRQPMCLEIASLAELKRAVLHYPQFKVLLLDNFSVDKLKLIVKWLEQQRLRKKYVLEASGGITYSNLRQYAKTGVDAISIGALTHSAPALDISLDIIPAK